MCVVEPTGDSSIRIVLFATLRGGLCLSPSTIWNLHLLIHAWDAVQDNNETKNGSFYLRLLDAILQFLIFSSHPKF
jgi:hypothetical protein